jgi:tRNA(fMet)-specific endonuclease VapC
MKVLDTDHCVAILRRRFDAKQWAVGGEELAITAITVGELAHGAHRSDNIQHNLKAVDDLLGLTIQLNFDAEAGRIFGELKAKLEIAGNIIEDLDLQIASIALRHDAPLVTHNQRHFKRVPNLKLEDWLK